MVKTGSSIGPSPGTATIDPDVEATFVPMDPPRASYFALWEPASVGGLPLPTESPYPLVEITLVLPSVTGPRPVLLDARRLSIRDALDVLGPLSVRADCRPSVLAWAAVLRSGLGLVARSRLLPWVSPAGWDTWRVDPLDSADHRLVEQLADALPAQAHCFPAAAATAAAGEPLLVEPVHAIRACYDALADRMVRTSSAAPLAAAPLFAQLQPTRVESLRPWVADNAAEHCSAAMLTIVVDPPADLEVDSDAGGAGPTADVVPVSGDRGQAMGGPRLDTDGWQLRFQLCSRQDPSLIVDSADLWRAPAEVMRLLGNQAEVDLLAGLRRAASHCDLFVPVLSDPHPERLRLDDHDIDALLDSLDALAAADIDVRWPAALVAPHLGRRLVASVSSPRGGGPSLGDLAEILSVDWEFLLDGSPLTAGELEILAGAKRSVVPIRGRWIRIDAGLRRRLAQPAPSLGAGEALAAALTGSWVDPDPRSESGEPDTIELRIEGPLAALVESLTAVRPERLRFEPEPVGLTATLRPYQQQGLAWMSDLAEVGLGGVLADDMGLGKTIQVLALHAKRGGPTLVVCPTSLLANWEREAARFVPGARVIRYHGSSRSLGELQPLDLVITTYGVVRSDAETLRSAGFDLVVADEAQHMKNPRSRTARSMRSLESASRFAVTGTPIENHLAELWSLIEWTVPGLLGPLDRFRRDVALPIERDNDTVAARRLSRLTAPFLLRRRKSDPGIAPELPPKTERNIVVPLTPEQMSLYRATTEEVLADVAANDGLVRHGLVLKLLTALKQITNHPAHYLGQAGPLVDRSGKLAALDELLDTVLDADESVLVFTQYVAMAELLASHLRGRGIDVGVLHGGLGTTARQRLVDRFQARELPVLLLSLRAGGTGLNLTAATQVVHYDRWWNPAVEDQATDRAHRIGQNRSVTVHRLITEGTVEDRVAELLDTKRALADRVIGGGESWFSKLDDAELAALVRLDLS